MIAYTLRTYQHRAVERAEAYLRDQALVCQEQEEKQAGRFLPYSFSLPIPRIRNICIRNKQIVSSIII